jgi:hypothetical protein
MRSMSKITRTINSHNLKQKKTTILRPQLQIIAQENNK